MLKEISKFRKFFNVDFIKLCKVISFKIDYF